MRVSYQWLREFVELPWTAEELPQVLTNMGLEVEAVDDWRGRYAGFRIGIVEEVTPHQQRDGLYCCRVLLNGEELPIVAGVAPQKGQRVVVALPGAVLPRTGMRIEPRTIAGAPSHGMLCSQWELGLGTEHERIWALPEDAPVGAALTEYLPLLEDVFYEVALTPNRGDCASHLGVARELAAAAGRTLRVPEPPPVEAVGDGGIRVTVTAAEGCPFYACAVVVGTAVAPTPVWMQLRLWQMGIAPHLLPVDVMNYVMLELGQPLHAFDFATIDRGHVIVRWAHPGELFQGLDGRAYELCSEDLLIADETKPLALAGVLGGAESQITPQTSAVLIESALFHPTSIRRTARRYGLETDAAYRFQRGVDPQGVVPALRRAVQFLVELGAGKLTAAVLVGKLPANSRRIQLRYAQIPRILGISLPSEQVHDVLERLGFRVEGQTPQACTLRVPPFRADVREEIDLIEELARLYGYERIPAADRALLPLESEPIPAELAPPPVRDTLVKVLVEWGLQQVFTPVLLDPETAQQWEEHPVQLVNARGAEFSVLRPSLVPSLARVLSHNVRVGERTVRIFELGKVFRRRGGDGQRLEDYEERLHLGILLSGAAVPLQWGMSPREVDFYDLRGVVEQLLERLRIAAVRWEPWSEGRPQPVLPVALRLFSGEHLLGWVGQLRPRWLRTLEVEQPAFVAILDVEALNACVQPLPWYVPVPEYPAVRRDLAFVVQQEVPVTELVEAIRQAAGEWLEEVTLFDVFVSPAIGEDKRSLAFALRFRSRERTLRDEDVNPIIERIVSEVERRTGAQWRR